MAFVMIATGANSRSRVRTLSVRPLIALAGVVALTLLASGGALGYWLADVPAPATAAASAAPEPVALPFTPRTGRRHLGAPVPPRKRSGAARQADRRDERRRTGTGAHAPGRTRKSQAEPAGAAGGPLLPERSESSPLGAIDAQLGRVEQQIASVASAAAEHSLA
jgi:hypothetical protein